MTTLSNTHKLPTKNTKYFAKLLLFGEHTVLKGSTALALPLPHFAGQWQINTTNRPTDFQNTLNELKSYLFDLSKQEALLCLLDFAALEAALTQAFYFDSNIPMGYGVGSSGALCAALYDQFCTSKIEKSSRATSSDLLQLKMILGQIESFFHGASSGIDPLVSYVNQPVFIDGKQGIRLVKMPKKTNLDKGVLFLLDTKIPRKTSPLVQLFLKKCEDLSYHHACQTQLIPQVNQAIEAFLMGRLDILFKHFHAISHFQFHHFQEMIPHAFRTLWEEGLQGDLFRLKLCGAGGGGFILGMTKDWETTKAVLSTQVDLKRI